MKKENNTLVLENEEDKELLFDMCDSYIFWYNEEDDDPKINEQMHQDYYVKKDLIINQVSGCSTTLLKIIDILSAFTQRDEVFVELWDKIFECLKLADLVKEGESNDKSTIN